MDWRGAWEFGTGGGQAVCVTTRWDLVLSAAASGRPGEEASSPAPAAAGQALAELCRLYRPPVLAYLLRQRHSLPDAEDLTQEFFARFTRGALLGRADREKGRFRAFLFTALKQFLAATDHACPQARRQPENQAGSGNL